MNDPTKTPDYASGTQFCLWSLLLMLVGTLVYALNPYPYEGGMSIISLLGTFFMGSLLMMIHGARKLQAAAAADNDELVERRACWVSKCYYVALFCWIVSFLISLIPGNVYALYLVNRALDAGLVAHIGLLLFGTLLLNLADSLSLIRGELHLYKISKLFVAYVGWLGLELYFYVNGLMGNEYMFGTNVMLKTAVYVFVTASLSLYTYLILRKVKRQVCLA